MDTTMQYPSLCGEMYNIRGWRGTGGSSSVTLLSASSLSSSDKMTGVNSFSNRIGGLEEVDGSEENDIAAPLPSEQLLSNNKQLNKPIAAKGISAKDKRRLREKRRSTGVANISGHETDELTTRNTSYNETPGVTTDKDHADEVLCLSDFQHFTKGQSSSTSTSTNGDEQEKHLFGRTEDHIKGDDSHQQPTQNDSIAQSTSRHDNSKIPAENLFEHLKVHDKSEKVSSSNPTPESTSGTFDNCYPLTQPSDFAKNLCPRPFEAKRGILKTPNRPVILPKPEIHGATSSSLGQRSNEELILKSRIAELEKLLDSERNENAVIKKLLLEKESKISELESQIMMLNEDLDLADEDYLRLEEENHAFSRALSRFNTE